MEVGVSYSVEGTISLLLVGENFKCFSHSVQGRKWRGEHYRVTLCTDNNMPKFPVSHLSFCGLPLRVEQKPGHTHSAPLVEWMWCRAHSTGPVMWSPGLKAYSLPPLSSYSFLLLPLPPYHTHDIQTTKYRTVVDECGK